mmetsp:Transcript_8811/g.8136  ORF Transcript_8811/g.8136 Transcript_8811/m.8136 type:complete len:270 (-) Transcript_8811:394-1203(-)
MVEREGRQQLLRNVHFRLDIVVAFLVAEEVGVLDLVVVEGFLLFELHEQVEADVNGIILQPERQEIYAELRLVLVEHLYRLAELLLDDEQLDGVFVLEVLIVLVDELHEHLVGEGVLLVAGLDHDPDEVEQLSLSVVVLIDGSFLDREEGVHEVIFHQDVHLVINDEPYVLIVLLVQQFFEFVPGEVEELVLVDVLLEGLVLGDLGHLPDVPREVVSCLQRRNQVQIRIIGLADQFLFQLHYPGVEFLFPIVRLSLLLEILEKTGIFEN